MVINIMFGVVRLTPVAEPFTTGGWSGDAGMKQLVFLEQGCQTHFSSGPFY